MVERDFGIVYGGFDEVYNDLKSVMTILYEKIQSESETEDNKRIFEKLVQTSLKLLSAQRRLVNVYGDRYTKDVYISLTDSKKTNMEELMNKADTKTKKYSL